VIDTGGARRPTNSWGSSWGNSWGSSWDSFWR
jgi:hypothetical protein